MYVCIYVCIYINKNAKSSILLRADYSSRDQPTPHGKEASREGERQTLQLGELKQEEQTGKHHLRAAVHIPGAGPACLPACWDRGCWAGRRGPAEAGRVSQARTPGPELARTPRLFSLEAPRNPSFLDPPQTSLDFPDFSRPKASASFLPGLCTSGAIMTYLLLFNKFIFYFK